MEASYSPEVTERLTAFVDRVVLFLDRLSEGPGVGTEEERTRLRNATAELRVLQAEELKGDIRTSGSESLDPPGFSPRQVEFKIAVAERPLDEAEERALTEWVSASRVWRALGKVKVVLGSLKSLSKWLEALDELVSMTAELAKNRLGPRLDE